MKYLHKWFNVSGINGTIEEQDQYRNNYDAIDWSDGKAPPPATTETPAEEGRQLELDLGDK